MDPANLTSYFEPKSRNQNPEQNKDHPYQIVIPLQPGGACAANCVFCNYGRKRQTPYATPETIVTLLRTGLRIALDEKLVEIPEQVKFSLLKGGEISLHPKFEAVLEAIYQGFPTVQVKISSIGAKNKDFLKRIIRYRRENPAHKLTLQISVNSTDEEQRVRLVNRKDSGAIQLYTLEDLSGYAPLWKEVSGGRCLSLTFTLMHDTVCDPEVLKVSFFSDEVVFRMRRMHPATGSNLVTIKRQDYETIYKHLANVGFIVIIGNPCYDELEHYLIQGWGFREK